MFATALCILTSQCLICSDCILSTKNCSILSTYTSMIEGVRVLLNMLGGCSTYLIPRSFSYIFLTKYCLLHCFLGCLTFLYRFLKNKQFCCAGTFHGTSKSARNLTTTKVKVAPLPIHYLSGNTSHISFKLPIYI